MISANIKERIKKLINREIFTKIMDFLELPDIVILMGMRQTGKTSLLLMTIDHLLKTVPETNLFYFSLEDSLVLDSFNKNQKELEKIIGAQKIDDKYSCYIFIDEVQHLNDPTRFLKYYHDNFSNYKFVVTGSSSFELRKKFKDSLAGRKKIINVHPLSFREFLLFKEIEIDLDKAVKSNVESGRISALWEEFMIYGGHPKISNLSAEDLKREELNDIYSSYLQRDIRDIGNIENISAYNSLIQMLGVQCGSLVSAKNISDNLELNQITLKKYLFLLEKSFALTLLRPFYRNKIKEITKMPKIYFEDLGIRNVAVSDFRSLSLRPDTGAIVENFVFNELQKRIKIGEELYFWRTINTQMEVDFVLKKDQELIPIEVKYQNFTQPNIPTGLKSFILEYKPKQAIVVTKNFQARHDFKGCKILFKPIFVF